ncbi:MAG: hypothetical protein H6Q76_1026 [Firmicutes bacterium]|nr:hypothetical protein [Bacillota bacterium]
MATCKFCGKEVTPGEFDSLFTEEALSEMPCSPECKENVLNKINLLAKEAELQATRNKIENNPNHLETIEFWMIVAQINACADQIEAIEKLEINTKPSLKWEL